MEFVVPPPPEDEWIPPPPPDNELVPPPPPDNELVPPPPLDDPPKASFPTPPSYTEPRQSLSYAEQYNLSYPGASFQYYGNTATEVPGSNIYRHAEGCQVAIPHSQLYYGAVPNAYTENVQVIANPVGAAAYYEFQDGSVPAAVSVISRVEPSGYQTESAPVTHDNLVSDQTASFSSSAAAGSNSVPHVTDGISCVVGGDNKASLDVPSTSATIQAAATIFVEESVSAPSATPVVSATLSLVPKVQSKVSRSKKRTVSVASSLRSNKKVSSLVDKWKAAKEELLEDEEEPESAYEILERKRQREIEEWRAKQIASGEAKDNANFQPLGGDWRERVKRKRAQSAKKSVESSEVAVSEQNQQPDLVELSKNLPYGWQAYWDASSKQVYYGNVLTSVTTWTRPTK
ncbi:WW domain containing protein [Quillaja saponaria]|uniref:WW domain containing protein n=1 Tax=Quillaja saponaria TaxID=32244 RepID=A0AAD7LUA9_QUISA|nr:WW domain containing protein [Quillaja saponaria]